jgi:hypothetical protein
MDGVIRVNVREFASLPDSAGLPPRMMVLVNEPGTQQLFVSDMRGPLYRVSYDGATVTEYVDLSDARWALSLQSRHNEQGFQSFVFHPDFARAGAAGFGRFYTYLDSSDRTSTPDFTTPHPKPSHDTILLEWRTRSPGASTYDGEPPRELIRFRQPDVNHNAGHLAFDPTAPRDSDEFGLLYVGVADGGGEGDPMGLSQNLRSAFGKILRIDPLGTDSANHKYGIPASNPFSRRRDALREIYAYGTRNPQRVGWDSTNRSMFVADIGQDAVEEISPVTPGANLGWNTWEGSFRHVRTQGVSPDNPRRDRDVTYPIAEWDHTDPLLATNESTAVTGLIVYRAHRIPQLSNRLLFGDIQSGEIYHVSADNLPTGGQEAIRRVLLVQSGAARTLFELIQEKNATQGRTPARRAYLRLGEGPDGRLFVLNKSDGTIRELLP